MKIFLILLIISVLIQLSYYLYFFSKLVFFKSNHIEETTKPVSVIICAKDEADNLKSLLPFIYSQNYPVFEVVLIDDRSMDNTWEIISEYKEKYPDKTKLVRVEFSDNLRFIANKKYALTLGIKAAEYENLLFTDADCKPVSDNWIKKMIARLSNNQLVLGYGKYQLKKKSFLNKLIRYETLQTALQYLSFALSGKAYMGVGRNLAYTRKLFFDNNGFYSHLDILSGDDDLFVNKVATADNAVICIDKDSFTVSKPKTTWREWIQQKRRHVSTAKHYKWKHKVLLFSYHLSLLFFYITTIILLYRLYYWKTVVIIILFRFLCWYYINYKISEKLNEKSLIAYLPVLEIVLIINQFIIFVINIFSKPKLWKN